ncbi:transaldolase [Mycolicibacterium celeriflavum]|uniref:Transaldolase n=1 Tax=Mycolicibacterium celeriflavum TaxID=1249101 RepID=A0A1X0C0W7_MYCCF|nr:transaldolase [Mycolicibacterium celeriflavum]MCV7238966.1 transaldolase [Mycolicibacterium celeriflavum]ORA50477.1 transaldolase [Mycolicibacterium celeriflavum]BBY45206.1 transaldolase [Mycolicibacterium celeriflavum]
MTTTRLERLLTEQRQSPWLDNLTRGYLRDGTLADFVAAGIRGVTANPTILARAIQASELYDEQFCALAEAGCSVEDAYWELAVQDVTDALAVLRPTYDNSVGSDGFVSIEVAPELARETVATVAAAARLHERIDRPNLLVKIPATAEGIPAITALIGRGLSINVTLIFSLSRYEQVIEAYLRGVEALADRGGDLAAVRSVASFFVSRVDTEVDHRLEAFAGADAMALRGRAGIAQARLAYRMFRDRFAGPRWEKLAASGAHLQPPLWASTSTKNPDYPDTLYVDSLIGPDTINTMAETTIAAFEDHGTVTRTLDTGIAEATRVMHDLRVVGVDMDDVGHSLEDEGVAGFHRSFADLLDTLRDKARQLTQL